MSKIRKRRETSADITIFRKTDNARLAGINVIKTQPVVILPLSRIPRQDSIGVREDLTTTELSSGGRIGKHQVLILNCISNQEANYYSLKVCHQASNVPEQDGLECAFPRLPGHLPGPQHPDGGGAETGVRVPFPLLLPGGAAECS